MPPVFGPSSLLSRRLWSCATGKLTKFSPSQIAKKLNSKPSKNSSTTTNLPASPKLAPLSMSLTASLASSLEFAMITPFPAQSPSAFTTIGALRVSINLNAFSLSSVFKYFAVFILFLAKKSFI